MKAVALRAARDPRLDAVSPRCMAVSVVTTALSLSALVALSVGAGMPATTANVIAVCCGIVPSYVANRRWTWGRRGHGQLGSEAVPFVALSLAGLVISTIVVGRIDLATAHWAPLLRSLMLPLGNLATFGALWVAQFVLLDRFVFVVAPVPECFVHESHTPTERAA